MEDIDKKIIIDRYLDRVKSFGHGPSALGEPKKRQSFYYKIMLESKDVSLTDSFLDVGCGYGDFYTYLRNNNYTGKYLGVDINKTLVTHGKELNPLADLRVLDLQKEGLEDKFDWCFSCHVLTSDTTKVDYLEYLSSMLNKMWERCDKGIIFNLLSPQADYTNPIHVRPDFNKILGILTRITNRFTLRHDYMPFEYTIHLYKHNQIDREKLIFSEYNRLFSQLEQNDLP